MRPENSQLLRSISTETEQANRHPERVDVKTVLDHVRIGVNELLLREDTDFIQAFIEKGRALSNKARELAGVRQSPQIQVHTDCEVDAIIAENAANVNALSSLEKEEASEIISQIVDWELELYAHRRKRAVPDHDDQSPMRRLTAENFERYLRAKCPDWRNVKVTAFKFQPGGYSKITVLVDLEDDVNGSHQVVIRAEPEHRMLDLDGMAIASEYPVVRFAYESGLPVAEPILLETDKTHIGFSFMLSRRALGSTLGSFVGAETEINDGLVRDVVSLIAKISTTPISKDDPLITQSHLGRWINYESANANTKAFIEYWRDLCVSGNSLPSGLLNYAVNWLLKNVPKENCSMNLIHGDVGFHNILFHDGRISALLDWENARVGDTAEELSMFVSSVADRYDHQTILDWYHDAGGPPVSEWRLRYFDVYAAMKIIVAAQVSLQRVQERPDHHLKLAVFGLQYMHVIGSRIVELIRLAEAAKALDPHEN